MLSLASLTAFGQALTGQLTGIVTDATGAIVPESKITLKNELSGDIRRSISNNEGYFTFAAVPSGTYTVIVEKDGFAVWERKGIAMSPGDRRTISEIILGAAGTTASVNISATGDEIATLDTGEKSAVVTEKQIQNLSLVGRNAAELIKILPGFTPISGIQNSPGFAGNVAGINGNGDAGKQSFVGNYSANGARSDALDISLDGARGTDPGCNCATPFNMNVDMVSEIKVQTSNFGADTARGPVSINGVSKGGGSEFHGTAYLYARHYALNSNSARNNALGQPKPESKFYFPGFNIGGPVLIPGTGFNKDRSKLNFFVGFEYIKQTLDTGLLQARVPTDAMRNGDFSQIIGGKVAGFQNDSVGGLVCAPKSDGSLDSWCSAPYKIAPTANGKALINLFPKANIDPTSNAFGNNYAQQIIFEQPNTQLVSRVDYSISDNTKLYVKYARQTDFQQFPVTMWWRNGDGVPYPSPMVADNRSHTITTNLTHVFSPTLTNEVVFGLGYMTFPNRFEDPSKISRKGIGYTQAGLYDADRLKRNNTVVEQIPNISVSGGASLANPGGFEYAGGGQLFANKWLPSISDNMTKVFKTHTVKFGAYWDLVTNSQPNSSSTHGDLSFNGIAKDNANTTGNAYADLLLGRFSNYSESEYNTLNNIGWKSLQFYVQDSWKLKSNLTLEFGMRVAHLGGIYDREGLGLAVWDPEKYKNNVIPGVSWNELDDSLPLSGRDVKSLYLMPRFGFSWDLFHTGNTVLRGGFGTYYFSDNQQGGYTGAIGIANRVRSAGTSAKNLSDIPNIPKGSLGVPLSLTVMNPNDDKQPSVHSWSLTASQRLPGKLLLDVAYVGNAGRNLINIGNQDINPIMLGSKYTQAQLAAIEADGNKVRTLDDPRRVLNQKYGFDYQSINLVDHTNYNNYHSLQMLLNKQTGLANYTVSYTFSKNLGIRGTDNSQSVDGTGLFGLRDRNYGVLATDRTHVLSLAYNFNLPDFGKRLANGNKFASAALDGWQFSGITQITSGPPLQAYRTNFGLDGTAGGGYKLNARRVLGTTSSNVTPRVKSGCDPTQGLSEGQYINVSCFEAPTYNPLTDTWVSGPATLPFYIRGPAFFNSDLSVFKTWNVSEHKRIQFRASAFNFLNHPLRTLEGDNLNLVFDNGVLTEATKNNFGRATQSRIGNRQMMLALKFYF